MEDLSRSEEEKEEKSSKELELCKDAAVEEYLDIEQKSAEFVEVTSANKNLLCDPCLFDDTNEEAVGFCVICVEYLCQGCCRDHKKSKNTRNHNILKDKLPADTSLFRLMKEMTSCSEHPDMPISHKCEDHNIYVCVMCIAGNHRKCDHVVELSKEVEPAGKKTTEVLKKLSLIQDKSSQVIKNRKESMTTLVSEMNEIQHSNTHLIQQIHERLLFLEQEAITKTEKMTKSEIFELQKDVDICKSVEKERVVFSQLLVMAEQFSSSFDINIIEDVVEEKILEINQILEGQQTKREIHLNFKQNPLLSKLKSLGNLQVCRDDPKVKKAGANKADIEGSSDEIIDQDFLEGGTSNPEQGSTPGNTETDISGVKEKQKTKGQQKQRKRTKKEKKFPVKVSGDASDCSITGIVILQDGRIVVIDQENRKIKVFSSSDLKFIFAHTIDAQPSDICRFGPKDFAVVYKDLKQIDIFTVVDKTLKVVRSWKTKYENVRIAMDRDLMAVLCKGDKDAKVQLRRENDCKVVLEANLPSGTQGDFDFDGCSLSSGKDELIVASASLGILCLARTPNMESLAITRTLNINDAIPGLRGVTADKDGNLYVCAPSCRSVIQISAKDYNNISTVVSGIEMPFVLAISNKKDRIIVGSLNDNYLHVINLKP